MTIFRGSVSLFLLLVMFGALFVTSVAATSRKVPTDYPTIQAAINAANPGDIVEVASGTYYEHVVVNKSLMLIGNDRSTTIIDGGGTGLVIRSNASNVEVRGFTIQNGGSAPYSGISIGSSINNTICDSIMRENAFGITLIGSNGCSIINNLIMNCSWAGIQIRDSSNNIIHDNLITNNSIGVYITSGSSGSNMFYHNNFINNLNQASDYSTTTKWDNGAEGSYWSDYVGVDLDGDGIGDTYLPHHGDYHPLIEPWSLVRRFNAGTWNGVTYYVTTFSNSTVASFSFQSVPLNRTSFNVTSGASGFCNVTIPIELLDGNFTVLIDDVQVQAPVLVITQNSTHSSLYFPYNSGTHHVEVYGTIAVVPEFPWSTPMLIFLVVLAILLVLIKRTRILEKHPVYRVA